ncbi:threonine/serine ThrE exporter family protein [Streptomyces sp. NBC_00448]|uniref:threonine/serine ThrE exporter family protein n=1 Tax=Streptomyces sp. NBC_00448 TaxID=2903652 RepID=UPI002E223BAF
MGGTARRSADALGEERRGPSGGSPEGPGEPGQSGGPEEPEGPETDPGPVDLGAALTPADGIPVITLPPEGGLWQDRMRAMLRLPSTERPAPPADRPGAAGTASGASVPRVLDLTLRIGELLLAGGEGAEDVEAAMFGVAFAYGLARVEPTVTFTLLGISYQPSLTETPHTMSRTVRRRGTDYTRLAAVFHLVDGITAHEVTLEEAYRSLADIRRNRHPYSSWVLTGAAGLLAGAASVLVGGGPLIFVLAALAAMLGDRLAWLLAARGLPEFYQFAVAAMPAAAMGVLVGQYGHWIPGATNVQSSAVITGGLFALLPGRALVAAVQDGLTGFYITASARLLEVVYLIVGIVIGVTLVLYAGVHFGARLNPDQALRAYDRPWVQLPAAMVLTLAFAVLLQCERKVLLVATLNGGVAWTVFGVLHQRAGGNQVAATAAAAGLVGLFGQLMARYRFVSVLPYITAAIGPLLPGSATYFGLLALTQHHQSAALSQLTKAAALALALAIGVNLGNEVARLALRAPGASAPRRAAKRTRGF